ncbi:MAG: acyl-homoserine-lactone synthase [Paracoccaceae bacterium]|nr:acyl-homoserine-lactone synthase [Paracoccaceae bacterium]
MLFLPTTADTMVNDHFLHLTNGVEIRHALIWERTRCCLSQDTALRVSANLMLAGMVLAMGFRLEHIVGVFDHRMRRFCRRIGWSLTITVSQRDSADTNCVGPWAIDDWVRSAPLQRYVLSANSSGACLNASSEMEFFAAA